MKAPTRRTLLAAGLVALLAVGGVIASGRLRPRPVAARGDPAVLAAIALGALERSETHALTAEQVSAVLPLLRVLRDTDPNDAEPSRALAQEIMSLLTPDQRAEVERLREEARRRQQERGGSGGPAGRGLGPPTGGSGAQGSAAGPGRRGVAGSRSRAEIRQRVLTRLITRLEQRK